MSASPEPDRQTAARLPESDVSPWVGLIGVAGLFVWIALCRNWPSIAEVLNLPGPRERMSGAYAALASMLFIGVLMAVWSVLVEKVHLRPSTGISWKNPRPLSSVIDVSGTKLAGLWATWEIIGFLYCVCRWYWDGQYLFAMEVIGAAAVPLFLLSVPYVLWLDRVLVNPRDGAWHFGAMLIGRQRWEAEQVKKHWRAWAIKAFFGAFMISILPPGFANIVNADIPALLDNPGRFGGALFELLFLIDVQIGTVGYLFTLRPLDAHIRSGNPFLGGWLAALICYPPFVWGVMSNNGVIGYEYHTADWSYWFQGHTALMWIWAGWLAVLTAVYAWATVAFGIRFSNLTYRGVLTNGPYRFTRHPAYLAKNAFWWCSTLPFFVTNGSLVDMVRNTFFLGCISAIYYWRARTEEAHLLAEDPKYREYYDWMAQHGLITSRLRKLLLCLRRRPPAGLQAAE
ncbi:protein-S-isoprenylcysteine methyltransferase [Altererythrobacter sp. CC-YST694]|uniref:methyltransferase family protein n=1 Tax=Altererythrobacter sp. CC-YST694 TaxID=2755038 RepID=UPI001D010A46|nr:protein-S-isoprenylcysteine methyltransferase [Altererythrobacter sp. CC-YST694]MCB5424034.1 protein-S-isoprenylcysteine methyltransferase [Altererythrobacter sp. CC-YST694]